MEAESDATRVLVESHAACLWQTERKGPPRVVGKKASATRGVAHAFPKHLPCAKIGRCARRHMPTVGVKDIAMKGTSTNVHKSSYFQG